MVSGLSSPSESAARGTSGSSRRRIPLALFTFNRPDHTQSTLAALAACDRRADYDFHFFSDAPRDESERPAVDQVRAILRQQQPRFNATLIEQSRNQGLSRSITAGVAQLCDRYGWVVVLEDDLQVAPGFLAFMAEALIAYENCEQIMQIAATTLAPPEDVQADAFLLPITSTWGWATWQRAWRRFSSVPEGWPEARSDRDWLKRFSSGAGVGYLQMLEDRLAGLNDSWGILWWYAVSRAGGSVVYPRRSLVHNSGFDGSGVHCGTAHADPPTHGSSGLWQQRWIDTSPVFPAPDSARERHLQLLQRALLADSPAHVRVVRAVRARLRRWSLFMRTRLQGRWRWRQPLR